MKTDWAAMLMADDGPAPLGLGESFWMVPQLPYEVAQRVNAVFEVLSHLPLKQAVVVVSDVGRTMAVNAPLLELTGGESGDYIGRQWSAAMPAWPERARGFRRTGTQVFEDHLARTGADPLWVRVSFGPVLQRGEERAIAYVLFITRPDVETIDHDEVRRLRKSLGLFAEIQADYVVEIDGDGLMTFVSPSFCRAVGATEWELVGHPFLARVHVEDREAAGSALKEARRPPFSGEVCARLTADAGTRVVWQMDAVIGAGFSGLDLVGRVQNGDGRASRAAPRREAAPAPRPADPAPLDPRLDAIGARLEALVPGDRASLLELARAVAAAAGAECVLYNVLEGDTIEAAVGWRLPPATEV
jgi:PAS domain S-box-containing protein